MIIHNVVTKWNNEFNRWKSIYKHSYIFFEVVVQNMWKITGNAQQKNSPRIRMQINIHVDSNFRKHINIFDWGNVNQKRKKWVKILRSENRLQFYARTMFFDWEIFVQKVKITIHYYEKVDKNDYKYTSVEKLSKNFKKSGRIFERNSGKGFFSRRPKIVIYHQFFFFESGILNFIRLLAREKIEITIIIFGKF